MSNLLSIEVITSKIFMIKGKKVMLDRDLAQLYEVTTKRLNEQVKRNLKRFPEDFMFQLTKHEKDELVAICDRFNKEESIYLRSQNATSKRGGRRYLPYAFTEQGVAMLSGVLNSDRAISVNIQIMRAFTYLRQMLLTNRGLKLKIEEMEKKYDKQFAIVFQAIKQLLDPPPLKPKPPIGFRSHNNY